MSDGSFGKICTGPTHEHPVCLPVTAEYWYFHGGAWAQRNGMTGKPLSRCKLCWQWIKIGHQDGPHGLVSATGVVQWMEELVQRCGNPYAVFRTHGLSDSVTRRLLAGKLTYVRRATAHRILIALSEQRKIDRRNGHSESFRLARVEQVKREIRLSNLSGSGY